ncbi:hypothetical protein DFH08DRAFT_860188 [Mycena albidolilacea]|uniref:Uncharacterized protein n=1 Tax=Mycena albidolilacea TaxID=1033008 RepID=A0AAD7EU24_9AGAR|nr:hypothetical protein DFH08DRAFT_860188 [Mycena albidolilacea]
MIKFLSSLPVISLSVFKVPTLASNPAGKIGANDKDQMEPIRRILDASFVFRGHAAPGSAVLAGLNFSYPYCILTNRMCWY